MSYLSNQTLVHKTERFLARLCKTENDSTFHYGEGDTKFIRKDGTIFNDKLSNFTYVQDEWGRPFLDAPKNGQFVAESAEKYLITPREMKNLRRRSIRKLLKAYVELESMILRDITLRVHKKIDPESNYQLPNYQLPFSGYDGQRKIVNYFIGRDYINNNYLNFTEWFLKRRNASVLSHKREFNGSWRPFCRRFVYADKLWDHTHNANTSDFFQEQP